MICIAISKLYGLPACINFSMLSAYLSFLLFMPTGWFPYVELQCFLLLPFWPLALLAFCDMSWGGVGWGGVGWGGDNNKRSLCSATWPFSNHSCYATWSCLVLDALLLDLSATRHATLHDLVLCLMLCYLIFLQHVMLRCVILSCLDGLLLDLSATRHATLHDLVLATTSAKKNDLCGFSMFHKDHEDPWKEKRLEKQSSAETAEEEVVRQYQKKEPKKKVKEKQDPWSESPSSWRGHSKRCVMSTSNS